MQTIQLGPSSVATPTEFNVWPSMATLSKPAKDSNATDTSWQSKFTVHDMCMCECVFDICCILYTPNLTMLGRCKSHRRHCRSSHSPAVPDKMGTKWQIRNVTMSLSRSGPVSCAYLWKVRLSTLWAPLPCRTKMQSNTTVSLLFHHHSREDPCGTHM